MINHPLMQFVDANIFLRFLTRDDEAKAECCWELLKKAQRKEILLTTSEAVIAEVIHLLGSKRVYNLPRTEVYARVIPVLQIPYLKIPHWNSLIQALEIYAARNIDFEDCLTVAHMERQRITEINSYDRDFDAFTGITRIEP